LKCDTEYSYYVKSVSSANASVVSAPSNTASATTLACTNDDPDISHLQPTNVRLEITGQDTAKLSWDAVEGATGYSIYTCAGKLITSTSELSYELTDLFCGTEHCFIVVAHNNTYTSLPSDEVSGTTDACDVPTPTPAPYNFKGLTNLVATGSNLWINILIALLMILGVGYFMFRKDLFHNEIPPKQPPQK